MTVFGFFPNCSFKEKKVKFEMNYEKIPQMNLKKPADVAHTAERLTSSPIMIINYDALTQLFDNLILLYP